MSETVDYRVKYACYQSTPEGPSRWCRATPTWSVSDRDFKGCRWSCDEHLAGVVRTLGESAVVKNLDLPSETNSNRQELLDFCRWLEKDEFGEGHEDEIVSRYLQERADAST